MFTCFNPMTSYYVGGRVQSQESGHLQLGDTRTVAEGRSLRSRNGAERQLQQPDAAAAARSDV